MQTEKPFGQIKRIHTDWTSTGNALPPRPTVYLSAVRSARRGDFPLGRGSRGLRPFLLLLIGASPPPSCCGPQLLLVRTAAGDCLLADQAAASALLFILEKGTTTFLRRCNFLFRVRNAPAFFLSKSTSYGSSYKYISVKVWPSPSGAQAHLLTVCKCKKKNSSYC